MFEWIEGSNNPRSRRATLGDLGLADDDDDAFQTATEVAA
jgi:hypothetical protein